MLFKSRSASRPFHFGLFPLETLPRDESTIEREAARPPVSAPERKRAPGQLVDSLDKFTRLYAEFADAEAAKEKAPVSDDLERRSADIKGVGYFMDASQVGICRIPDNSWLAGVEPCEGHDHAIVVLIEHSRVAEEGNIAREWMLPAVAANAEMRAAEIGALIAGHIRVMGYGARMHGIDKERLDADRLAVLAGLAVRQGDRIVNPFVGDAFSVCVVSTDYPLAVDKPLADKTVGADRGFGYWLGRNGARSGRERNRRAKRRTDLGPFAMETVKRVDRPTTLILDEEVPRVPKRASFFERALQGDLGVKAQMARRVFSFKHPLSLSQLKVIRSMVPYQDGPVAEVDTGRFQDAEANTRALKSLAYFLGTDVAGICEVPRYAWYSHKANSEEIEPYHKYAVVMLIDQGFDTMEGASGDDWISGAQSMRAYLRGAEIRLGDGRPRARQRLPGALADQRRLGRAAHPAGALGRAGRAVADRRADTQPVPRAPAQDRGDDHRHAAGARQADRFRPPVFLQPLLQMRPRMPLRRDSLGRQGDVQRIRDLEAGCRALHPLSPDQRQGLGLRALHEDLPA